MPTINDLNPLLFYEGMDPQYFTPLTGKRLNDLARFIFLNSIGSGSGTGNDQSMNDHLDHPNPHPQYVLINEVLTKFSGLLGLIYHVGSWHGTNSLTWDPSIGLEPYFGYRTTWTLLPYSPYGVDENTPSGTLITPANLNDGATTPNSGTIFHTRIWCRLPDGASAPNYTLTSDKSNVDEGSTVTFTLTTTGLNPGSIVQWNLLGSATPSDYTPNNTGGYFTIGSDGKATMTKNIVADKTDEGPETLTLKLTNIGNEVTVTINDTSKTPIPTYTASFNKSSIDENESVVLNIATTDVDDNTVLNLVYSGTADDNDFVGTRPNSVTIINNSASITYTSIADGTDDSSMLETMTVSIQRNSSQVASASVNINDTSRTPLPTYTSKFTGNSSGSGSKTDFNEGETAYFVINTTLLPDYTVIDLEYSGSASNDDFTSGRPSSVTIMNNQAIVPYQIVNDMSSEGNESMTITMKRSSSQVGSNVSMNIIDTSLTPTFDLYYSTNVNGTDVITQANEGTTVYAIVKTTNISDGTVLNLTFSGSTVDANDFTSSFPSNINNAVDKATIEQENFKASCCDYTTN
jgi:hypothetical protein